MTRRRGNGLFAKRYVPLAQVNPRLADEALEALRRFGIAGYTAAEADSPEEEAAGDAPPAPETERLYVDAAEEERAEEVLRAEFSDWEEYSAESERSGSGTAVATASSEGGDAVWDDLVARFYATEQGESRTAWPDAENVAQAAQARRAAEEPEPEAEAADPPPERRARTGGALSEEEDHYIPPPPPPLPSGDGVSRMSWAGVLGGPALLLLMTLLGMRIPGWVALLAVAGFIGGFVVLVARMGDRPPRDSGPDDGAVV